MESLPSELENIIKDYVIFKPKTKDELLEAIALLFFNKVTQGWYFFYR